MVTDMFGDAVTEERWHKVELCIKEFIKRHPKHWAAFKQDLHENRTEYQAGLDKGSKASNFRNTASFPVVYRKATEEEMRDVLTGQEEDNLIQVASLIDPLKVLLPGLIDADKPGKPNKLYREFLKRFPVFIPGYKNSI